MRWRAPREQGEGYLRRILGWLSVFALLAAGIATQYQTERVGGLASAALFILAAVLAGLAAILLAYLIASGWLRRRSLDEGTRTERRMVQQLARALRVPPGVLSVTYSLDDVDWEGLISGAKTCDIVADFADGILRRMNRDGALDDAFRQGLCLRYLTFDANDPELVRTLDEQRNLSRQHRGLDGDNLVQRRDETIRILHNARLRASSPEEAVRVYRTRSALPYSAFCFDGRTLVLTPKAITFSLEARAPRFVLDLEAQPRAAEYWRAEWRWLAHRYGPPSVGGDPAP